MEKFERSLIRLQPTLAEIPVTVEVPTADCAPSVDSPKGLPPE
jgi:hypothetical protein